MHTVQHASAHQFRKHDKFTKKKSPQTSQIWETDKTRLDMQDWLQMPVIQSSVVIGKKLLRTRMDQTSPKMLTSLSGGGTSDNLGFLVLQSERTDNQCRPDVRMCNPLLLYLFINLSTPTCFLESSLDFLSLFLGISYSKRVSRQDPMWDPFITPHLKRPRLRST